MIETSAADGICQACGEPGPAVEMLVGGEGRTALMKLTLCFTCRAFAILKLSRVRLQMGTRKGGGK